MHVQIGSPHARFGISCHTIESLDSPTVSANHLVVSGLLDPVVVATIVGLLDEVLGDDRRPVLELSLDRVTGAPAGAADTIAAAARAAARRRGGVIVVGDEPDDGGIRLPRCPCGAADRDVPPTLTGHAID